MTTTHTPADVLLPLVVRRLAVAESVAVAKWSSGRPVEDRDREAVVLSAAAARAQRVGIDATLVYRVMAAQIEASKIVQRGLIARWRDQPASAPTSRPGLRGVRQTLEAIDEEFVTALAAPGLPVAHRRVLEQCDGLRRRALGCALAPLNRSAISPRPAHPRRTRMALPAETDELRARSRAARSAGDYEHAWREGITVAGWGSYPATVQPNPSQLVTIALPPNYDTSKLPPVVSQDGNLILINYSYGYNTDGTRNLTVNLGNPFPDQAVTGKIQVDW